MMASNWEPLTKETNQLMVDIIEVKALKVNAERVDDPQGVNNFWAPTIELGSKWKKSAVKWKWKSHVDVDKVIEKVKVKVKGREEIEEEEKFGQIFKMDFMSENDEDFQSQSPSGSQFETQGQSSAEGQRSPLLRQRSIQMLDDERSLFQGQRSLESMDDERSSLSGQRSPEAKKAKYEIKPKFGISESNEDKFQGQQPEAKFGLTRQKVSRGQGQGSTEAEFTSMSQKRSNFGLKTGENSKFSFKNDLKLGNSMTDQSQNSKFGNSNRHKFGISTKTDENFSEKVEEKKSKFGISAKNTSKFGISAQHCDTFQTCESSKFGTSTQQPKFGSKFGLKPNNDKDEEEQEGQNKRVDAFKTAGEQLALNYMKKHGQKPPSKTLGSSRFGFKPPVLTPAAQDDPPQGHPPGEPPQETDERLKNVDPKMVELIRSEIMDSGSKVTWNDIAGLTFVKKTVMEIVVYPLLRPDIFKGLKAPPKGLLLFGPPGTGKTLIGKPIWKILPPMPDVVLVQK